MNLTRGGTELNIENLAICDNKGIIFSSIADYENQWFISQKGEVKLM